MRNAANSYNHEQTAASDTWTIVHGLNAQPIVAVQVDLEGVRQAILPMDISYPDFNTVVVSFSRAFTGSARLV